MKWLPCATASGRATIRTVCGLYQLPGEKSSVVPPSWHVHGLSGSGGLGFRVQS